MLGGTARRSKLGRLLENDVLNTSGKRTAGLIVAVAHLSASFQHVPVTVQIAG